MQGSSRKQKPPQKATQHTKYTSTAAMYGAVIQEHDRLEGHSSSVPTGDGSAAHCKSVRSSR
jgi:hypothetical protein